MKRARSDGGATSTMSARRPTSVANGRGATSVANARVWLRAG